MKDKLLTKTQNKWFRNLNKAQIQILEQVYTLQVTNNKRELIYNKNNKLIKTNPYVINTFFYEKY